MRRWYETRGDIQPIFFDEVITPFFLFDEVITPGHNEMASIFVGRYTFHVFDVILHMKATF